jgi:hypothetical protein
LLADAEQAAHRAEADAQQALHEAAADKVRTGTDTTAAARSAYQQAMADLAVAETEHEAGKRVVLESEHELKQVAKDAHKMAAQVAKSIADAEEPSLVAAARTYGEKVARHRALTRFARAASADGGSIVDPIPELNANNPLAALLQDLTAGRDVELHFSEQTLLDAKLGAP